MATETRVETAQPTLRRLKHAKTQCGLLLCWASCFKDLGVPLRELPGYRCIMLRQQLANVRECRVPAISCQLVKVIGRVEVAILARVLVFEA